MKAQNYLRFLIFRMGFLLLILLLHFPSELQAQPDLLNVMPNGNVGIGISTPLFPLDISANQGVLRVVTTTHTNGSVIDLRSNVVSPTFLGAINFNNTTGNAPGQIAYTGNNALTFRTGGSEKLRIHADGDVGIGILAPSHKLHVVGSESSGAVGHFDNTVEFLQGYGLYADCDNTDGYGYGGYFEGGYCGAFGEVTSTGINSYFGLKGMASTESGSEGNGSIYGVSGAASKGAVNYGVYGSAEGGTGTVSNYGVYGTASGTGGNWAGFFQGNIHVNGTLSKTSGTFKIDHPLDPGNKYLSHSFVESPDMMNIYNGNTVTDENGEAIVELPDYFESLNMEYRYQLTCIGGWAPLYIAEEISGNQFKIAGGESGMKVSWQITGIRQDAYAKAHPIKVEEDKPDHERGKYLNPEVFGKPKVLGVHYRPEQESERRKMEEHLKGNDEGIVHGKKTDPENGKN